ncbi:MAG: SGNH/GDSL hydrolase family protein [Steroidobacteraceae bacterium]
MQQFASKTTLTLAAVLIACAGVIAALALRFAHGLYLERAELRLNPAQASHFARDNRQIGAPGLPRVVFFGDSRVSSWQPQPQVTGRELVWRGIAGQTTAQMALRYETDVLALSPSVVVIQAGINDLVAGSALGTSANAMEQLLRNLHSFVGLAHAANARVCLLTIVPPQEPSLLRQWWSGDAAGQVAIANRHIQSMRAPAVTVIDIAGEIAAQPASTRKSMMSDALHFTASGYELLNSLLGPCFRNEADAVQ